MRSRRRRRSVSGVRIDRASWLRWLTAQHEGEPEEEQAGTEAGEEADDAGGDEQDDGDGEGGGAGALGHEALHSVARKGDDEVDGGAGPGGAEAAVGDEVAEVLLERLAVVVAEGPGVQPHHPPVEAVVGVHVRPVPGPRLVRVVRTSAASRSASAAQMRPPRPVRR